VGEGAVLQVPPGAEQYHQARGLLRSVLLLNVTGTSALAMLAAMVFRTSLSVGTG